MNVVVSVALAVLMVAGLLCLVRVLRPASIADRIVGLDGLLVVIVNGVAVYTLTEDGRHFIDLLVVTALLGFLGTVLVARFIERRGA